MGTQERKSYYKYFMMAKRTRGQSYFKCTEDAPDDLKDLIRAIHGLFDCMPDDWIYEQIWEAFDDLDTNFIEDIHNEPHPYLSELYAWLGEPYARHLCDQVIGEGWRLEGIYEIIEEAQVRAKDIIYRAVDDFIKGSK